MCNPSNLIIGKHLKLKYTIILSIIYILLYLFWSSETGWVWGMLYFEGDAIITFTLPSNVRCIGFYYRKGTRHIRKVHCYVYDVYVWTRGLWGIASPDSTWGKETSQKDLSRDVTLQHDPRLGRYRYGQTQVVDFRLYIHTVITDFIKSMVL